ncbi:hypothetical protein HY251_07705 [bacterium]|nr:hypothetical protein [bacterium]
MTRCEDVRPLLAEAALEPTRELEAHLQECRECASEAAALRETIERARAARPEAPAFPALVSQVREACGLDPARPPGPAARGSARGGLAAAALVGVAIGLALVVPHLKPAPLAPAPAPSPSTDEKKTFDLDRRLEDVKAKLPVVVASAACLEKIDQASDLVLALSARPPERSFEESTWHEDRGSFFAAYGAGLEELDGRALDRAIAWLPESRK